MHKIYVKKLDPRAILPTVAHPGEDLGYDIYALEDTPLPPGKVVKVRTGIAVEAYISNGTSYSVAGLLIRDRSSMASKGIFTHAGVIDAGYRGECVVVLTALNHERTSWELPHELLDEVKIEHPYVIKAGDKIAQMIPVPVLTGQVYEAQELTELSRGDKGFGSSGR